jgi:hypothetical protein
MPVELFQPTNREGIEMDDAQELDDDRTIMTSSRWRRYFRANRDNLLTPPWGDGAQLTEAERDAIARSIAEFQLGESSEGKHLIAAARQWAGHAEDPDYVLAVGMFIAEENRHAGDLGRFMDLEGIAGKKRTFADSVFRRLRKLARLELSISVLVTAEVIAQVYYQALAAATGSTILRALCEQILRDEDRHVRFQCERLAILRRHRGPACRALCTAAHRVLMLGAILVVWMNHGRALAAGGHGWRRFWRSTWDHAERAFRVADSVFHVPQTSAERAAVRSLG